MKCLCSSESASRYERLSDDGTSELCSIPEDRDTSESDFHEFNFGPEDKDYANKKEEDLYFFNDDGSYQTVLVERNLCANDLCQLLALKNRVPKSENWSIIEQWKHFGLERTLEDHEYVLSTHKEIRIYANNAKYSFIFRKDFKKYEFFHQPQQISPSSMIDTPLSIDDDFIGPTSLQNLITKDGQSPIIFSHMWIRDPQKQIWGKAFILLKDKKLYLSYTVQVLAKFYRSSKTSTTDDLGGVRLLATISQYQLYITLNAKNQFKAPTEWGLCLRPAEVDAEDFENHGLICFACDTEQVRSYWLTAMRLAKYGKQLRENYRAFKNKQTESINPKDYNSYTVPNESVRSRVAMDFTGSVGRIVDDPKEAKAIAVAEGYSWKRRWRPSCRAPNTPIQGIESGVHVTQPWFHSGMSRDQASSLVSRHGQVDGVFLVRESRSHPGAFVLTYKFGGKVLHAQIAPILDPVKEAHVFSLDSGVTKFYDLLQLVEFYQLNAGCLPTRLTHYVVQSSNIINNTTTINSSNGF